MAPYTCFKYRPINKYLIDSLVRSRLYFAPRSKLNDPFDCNVDLAKIIDRLLEAKDTVYPELLRAFGDNKEILERLNKHLSLLGICSFSLKPKDTLMWSHYADDHKGVVLHYRFPQPFLSNADEILGSAPVSYDPNAISNWLRLNIQQLGDNQQFLIIELVKKILSSKAPPWKYEQEARIIRPIAGPYEIPRSFLTDIIFGLQNSPEDKLLIGSITNKYYSSVKFHKIVRAASDFGITTEEIDMRFDNK